MTLPSPKNIVAIIPSRFGSSRFEGKPLARIGGLPMIQHVAERAASAPAVAAVYVATDDRRIADAVSTFGGRAVMTSERNRSGTDRVAEAAEKLQLDDEDIVINVQGDQPLMNPRCLEQLLAPLKAGEEEVEMSTLAYRIVDRSEITNPKDVKVVFAENGRALYFSRSPIPCAREHETDFDTFKHLGFYAYTNRFLQRFRSWPTGRLEQIEKLEQLRALEQGHSIAVVVTEFDSPEVDLPEDILRIEQRLRKGD
ncbi:MAG: 3-deoxy-manno-octulosonate cytidylyltransferase [Desulfobacteraceae bacterium]|nr:3-deoxy-manno-octulosonate cytidylyltransferase [Desulfobacteraceae bacterium]